MQPQQAATNQASAAITSGGKWPRITLVTPTYNRATYLEETILSVITQDYPNLEYIIVDGGSTDPEVLRIIRKYEDKLAWWLSERDGGHAEAIRKGFDRSTGEIMNWICSDDALLPGALRTMGEAFMTHPEAEVVYGNAHIMDEHSEFVTELRSVPYSTIGLLVGMNMHQTSVFWRRSLYERAGGNVGGESFEYTRYSPDSDLFFRFAKAKARWFFVRKPLAKFRVHAGQVSTAEVQTTRQYALRAVREQFPFWGSPAIYYALRLCMHMRRVYWHSRQGEVGYVFAGLFHRLRALNPLARR